MQTIIIALKFALQLTGNQLEVTSGLTAVILDVRSDRTNKNTLERVIRLKKNDMNLFKSILGKGKI